jgi:hypothetical protein
MVSVKMEAILKRAQSARIVELSEAMMQWNQETCTITNLQNLGKDVLKMLEADVLVARIQDPKKEDTDTVIIGDRALIPGELFWKKFDEKQPRRELCSLNTRKQLVEEMGLSEADCPASGVVYFRDGLVQIMFGRGERAKDVVWGGNPDEPKLRIGGILCPRKSFEKFMQKAKVRINVCVYFRCFAMIVTHC